MKKINFLEKLQIDLTAGLPVQDNLDRFDIRFLEAKVDDHFNGALFEIYQVLKNRGQGFKPFDSLCKAYKNVAVTLDSDRDEYYSELPTCLSSIPAHIAIREVRPMKTPSGGFVQIESNQLTTLAELPVYSLLSNRIWYYLDGTRIYYKNYDGFDKVLIRLVVPFTSYAMSDEIPMPVSMRGSVYSLTLNELRGVQVTPTDSKNNNTEK